MGTNHKRNSKPVRIPNSLLEKLEKFKSKDEPWATAIAALLKDSAGRPSWTLPSYTFQTKNEALVVAMELAALKGLEYEQMEQPIKVKAL